MCVGYVDNGNIGIHMVVQFGLWIDAITAAIAGFKFSLLIDDPPQFGSTTCPRETGPNTRKKRFTPSPCSNQSFQLCAF